MVRGRAEVKGLANDAARTVRRDRREVRDAVMGELCCVVIGARPCDDVPVISMHRR